MKNHRTLKLCILVLCTFSGIAYGRRITQSYKSMTTGELRYRSKTRDAEGVLALGLRNDASSVPLLQEIASMPIPTEPELKSLLHVQSLKDPVIQADIKDYQRRYWESSFAAKAALMRMHAGDYLNDFIVQLTTSNFDWKRDVIDDLGYASDPRAIKYLGPLLLDDRTYSDPGSEHAFGQTISEATSDAMGQILQPKFMDIQKQHPEQFHVFYNEWKQWWKENRDKYSDPAFPAQQTSAPPPAAQSAEIKVLRQTFKQQPISIGIDAGGNAAANLNTIQLAVPTLRGEAITVDVAIVMTSAGGLFWWEAHRSVNPNSETFLDTHKFYVLQEKMVGFSVKGTNIIVSEQSEHMKTIDDALKSVAPKIQSGADSADSLPQGTQTVALWDVLGRGYFMSGSIFTAPVINDVARKDSHWVLQLQNANNDKAIVILGSDYEVTSATINGKSVYPK